ncbi:unnamed protein product [Calypogeia fissa]
MGTLLPVATTGKVEELHLLNQSFDGLRIRFTSCCAFGGVALGCLVKGGTFGLTKWGGDCKAPEELDLSSRGFLMEVEDLGDWTFTADDGWRAEKASLSGRSGG